MDAHFGFKMNSKDIDFSEQFPNIPVDSIVFVSVKLHGGNWHYYSKVILNKIMYAGQSKDFMKSLFYLNKQIKYGRI